MCNRGIIKINSGYRMKTIKKLTTIFGLTLIIFLVGCATVKETTVKETTVEEVVIEPVEKEYDDLFGIRLIYLI